MDRDLARTPVRVPRGGRTPADTRRSASHPSVPGRDAAAAVRTLVRSAGGAAGPTLGGLQRAAGNAAVGRLLGTPPVQRAKVFHDPSKPLQWKHFTGAVPSGATHSAATASAWDELKGMFSSTYSFENGTYTATAKADSAKMNIRSYVDTGSSWAKADHRSSALLAHEQGHFDITHVIGERTEAAMKKVATTVTKTGAGGDAKGAAAASEALDEVSKPVLDMFDAGYEVNEYAQCRYDGCMDVGTNHGTRAAQQAQWNRWIGMGLPTFTVPLDDVEARMRKNGCPDGGCSP